MSDHVAQPAGAGQGDAFEYDKARRLTVAWMGSDTPSSPSGNVYVKKIDYGMDDDGNRTTVTVTPYGSSPVNTSYTDNSLNQYTVVGGVSRSHDGNGNVSDDGTYLYEYNYKNLICRIKLKSNSSTVAEYKYDALGRRVEKTLSGATYRYIYSGVETVSVYTSTGTWKQDYVYGPGIDEVLMLEQADVLDWDGDSNTSELARSWYRANALGSIMRIEEPDKTEAVSYRYDPYGEVTITRGGSGQGSDPLGQYVTYTGRWRDEETGLYHYRARTYDPVRGRFLQRDPHEIDDAPTVYEYARHSPLAYADPNGEFAVPAVVVAAIWIGARIAAKHGVRKIIKDRFFHEAAIALQNLCQDKAKEEERDLAVPLTDVAGLPKCLPCGPPPASEIDKDGKSHGNICPSGVHWHYYVFSFQRPYPDCTCAYARYFGGCCGAEKVFDKKIGGKDAARLREHKPVAPAGC